VSEDDGGYGEDLLSRALAGESAAFRALVVSHQRLVYSLALRMLSDRHQAEDLSQEVFVQLHRNLASVESLTHLTFWLRRVTMNRAIDRLRREPHYATTSIDEAVTIAAEGQEGDPLLQRRLRTLIAELPPAARAVVLLRYQEDLDPVDIGRTLKMPVNTVKSHLKRSLAILRERMQATAEASRVST
jgi:RNA polymerase sigma-70 factor, ECF subfamily